MSVFLDDWKQSQLEKLKTIFPDLSNNKILLVLEEDIKKNFQDRESIIHNDYQDNMQLKQPLSSVYRFCMTEGPNKPILAGNGTLFYNQDKVKSPIADLIDDRIATRKYWKNLMKDALKERNKYEEGSEEYNHWNEEANYRNMRQMEAKIRINSIYGSFGAPTFQLYNKYTAASTTGTAQSLISATGIAFEAFLGDHVLFKTFGECISFMNNIIHEEYKMPILSIKQIKDVEVVYNRMKNNFVNFEEDLYGDLLWDYLSNLNVELLTRIYYKNNIYDFINNDCIKTLIIDSFNNTDSFNDPNSLPKSIESDMTRLWEYCKEFVFYNHVYPEQINRLKNDQRKVVKLIDTDSNLVYVQPWVDYLNKEIVPHCDKTSMSGDTLMFACVNTIAYMITEMLKDLLWSFTGSCNVLEDYRLRINMKNEFCFLKLLLAPTKKRYGAKMVLQEGIPVNKTEIKGYDFKKAAVSEYVSQKMTSILETRILNSPEVDIKGMLRDLDEVEKDIYKSLQNGERKFLLRMNCKVTEAYKNPMSMGQVLSVLAWNTICPDDEIMVPDKLDVCLMKIPNEAALEPIKDKFPKEYDRINRLLLHGPLEVFNRKGVKYIAIPNSYDKMPDWMIPLIDYDYISSRNLGTFNPILEALGLQTIGSNDMTHFGNIRVNREVLI